MIPWFRNLKTGFFCAGVNSTHQLSLSAELVLMMVLVAKVAWRYVFNAPMLLHFTQCNVGLLPSNLPIKCSNQGLLRLALRVLDFLCRGVEDKRWTGRTFYVQSTRPEVVTPSSADVAKRVFTVKEMIICLVFATVQIAQIENWCKQQNNQIVILYEYRVL